ncbi:MAG: hypothetical protein K0R14_367 [Burkholderiales bacterium]|jgi:hypothetical protein|nr:hypothetical protein [Burkholderiales bacterium]
MRAFYENLDMIDAGKASPFSPKFPNWQVGYDELLGKSVDAHSKVEIMNNNLKQQSVNKKTQARKQE